VRRFCWPGRRSRAPLPPSLTSSSSPPRRSVVARLRRPLFHGLLDRGRALLQPDGPARQRGRRARRARLRGRRGGTRGGPHLRGHLLLPPARRQPRDRHRALLDARQRGEQPGGVQVVPAAHGRRRGRRRHPALRRRRGRHGAVRGGQPAPPPHGGGRGRLAGGARALDAAPERRAVLPAAGLPVLQPQARRAVAALEHRPLLSREGCGGDGDVQPRGRDRRGGSLRARRPL
jgi:hypothetical protein